VVWHARGIGVSGQRKGRRRVFIPLFRLLLPIIFPTGAPLHLALGVCESGVGACACGKGEGGMKEEWCGVLGDDREGEVEAMTKCASPSRKQLWILRSRLKFYH
jgi:hypothetical protein